MCGNDQAKGDRWRKDCSTASIIAGKQSTAGGELNRTFYFLCNYTKHFDTSNDPASATFYGTAPSPTPKASERNSLYGMFPNIRQYIDIHHTVSTILYLNVVTSESPSIYRSISSTANTKACSASCRIRYTKGTPTQTNWYKVGL